MRTTQRAGVWVVAALALAMTTPGFASEQESSTILQSAKISGNKGGVLKAGRFTLTVPAGSYHGYADVGIAVPHADATICEVQIFPRPSRDFGVPFLLSADLRDASVDVLPNLAVLSYDTSKHEWLTVPGSSVDWMGEEVEAPLSHFSTFMVGDPELGRSKW